MNMNAVGIDVSKGKSMVAILRPYGEIVSTPFEVRHTVSVFALLSSISRPLMVSHALLWNIRGVITNPLSVNSHRLTFLYLP